MSKESKLRVVINLIIPRRIDFGLEVHEQGRRELAVSEGGLGEGIRRVAPDESAGEEQGQEDKAAPIYVEYCKNLKINKLIE